MKPAGQSESANTCVGYHTDSTAILDKLIAPLLRDEGSCTKNILTWRSDGRRGTPIRPILVYRCSVEAILRGRRAAQSRSTRRRNDLEALPNARLV